MEKSHAAKEPPTRSRRLSNPSHLADGPPIPILIQEGASGGGVAQMQERPQSSGQLFHTAPASAPPTDAMASDRHARSRHLSKFKPPFRASSGPEPDYIPPITPNSTLEDAPSPVASEKDMAPTRLNKATRYYEAWMSFEPHNRSGILFAGSDTPSSPLTLHLGIICNVKTPIEKWGVVFRLVSVQSTDGGSGQHTAKLWLPAAQTDGKGGGAGGAGGAGWVDTLRCEEYIGGSEIAGRFGGHAAFSLQEDGKGDGEMDAHEDVELVVMEWLSNGETAILKTESDGTDFVLEGDPDLVSDFEEDESGGIGPELREAMAALRGIVKGDGRVTVVLKMGKEKQRILERRTIPALRGARQVARLLTSPMETEKVADAVSMSSSGS